MFSYEDTIRSGHNPNLVFYFLVNTRIIPTKSLKGSAVDILSHESCQEES